MPPPFSKAGIQPSWCLRFTTCYIEVCKQTSTQPLVTWECWRTPRCPRFQKKVIYSSSIMTGQRPVMILDGSLGVQISRALIVILLVHDFSSPLLPIDLRGRSTASLWRDGLSQLSIPYSHPQKPAKYVRIDLKNHFSDTTDLSDTLTVQGGLV